MVRLTKHLSLPPPAMLPRPPSLSLSLPPRSLDGRPAIASGLFSRVRSIQDPTKHKMARTTFALIAMHGAIASSLATPPSVVRLYDAASRRPVLLVGTMHYNPYSVSVVQGAIRAAARQHGLHAAAIELCPSRWNSTSAAQWRDKRFQRIPTYQRVLSEDEFQVAWEAAVDLGLSDVILADQPIALTGRQLGSALVCTLTDLLTPAGWRRVAVDLQAALGQLPSFVSTTLNGQLLAGSPLAFARYLYQSPSAAPFIAFAAVALGVAAAVDEATGATATWEDGVVTSIVALVLGRAAFVSLIQERDLVLARNIRDACLAQRGDQAGETATTAVVAVLGMAHVPGVREALLKK